MSRLARLSSSVALAACLAACSSDGIGPGPEPGPEPGLYVPSNAVTDSVGTRLPDLVVEVRGPDGAPLAGAEVRFEVVRGQPAYISLTPVLGLDIFTRSAVTDTAGHARTWVHTGTRPGTVLVVVTVPSAGYQDTVTYTITTGRLARIDLQPADTAVYAGAAIQPRISGTDRFDNPLPDAITLGTGTPVVVTLEGAQVRARATGRGVVTAVSGGLADTAYVSVVPQGMLVAREQRHPVDGWSRHLVLTTLDGSERSTLLPAASAAYAGRDNVDIGPEWIPGTDEIAFYDGHPKVRLWAVNPRGEVRPLFLSPPAGTDDLGGQRFTRDGAWVYFNVSSLDAFTNQVWRARADGSGAERITPATPAVSVNDLNASPSPDGTHIVYMSDRLRNPRISPPFDLVVMPLSTRRMRSLGVTGRYPQWSPVADQIAYERDGRIWVIDADGTDERALTPAGTSFEPRVSWSPDGAWIVAAGTDSYLHLIRVETGELLPLVFARLIDPDWRD